MRKIGLVQTLKEPEMVKAGTINDFPCIVKDCEGMIYLVAYKDSEGDLHGGSSEEGEMCPPVALKGEEYRFIPSSESVYVSKSFDITNLTFD